MSTATVTIGTFTLELPEAEGRDLFLQASLAVKRGLAALAISADTTVIITPAIPISITIAGGFVDEYNPTAAVENRQARKPRPGYVFP